MKKNKILKSAFMLTCGISFITTIPLTSTSCSGEPIVVNFDKINSVEGLRNFDPSEHGLNPIEGVDYTVSPYSNSPLDEKMLVDFSSKIMQNSEFFKLCILNDYIGYLMSFCDPIQYPMGGMTQQYWDYCFSNEFISSINYELSDFSLGFSDSSFGDKRSINFFLHAKSHIEITGKLCNPMLEDIPYTVDKFMMDIEYNFSQDVNPIFLENIRNTQYTDSSSLQLSLATKKEGTLGKKHIIVFHDVNLGNQNVDSYPDSSFSNGPQNMPPKNLNFLSGFKFPTFIV